MLADDAMRNKDFKAADKQYYDAWCDYAQKRTAAAEIDKVSEFDDTYSFEDAFWLLISGANSQFCAGDYDGCLDTCMFALDLFKDVGYVAGNPFFHLLVGQACLEIDPSEANDKNSNAIDNLARALICGGIEIFNHEHSKYLEPVLKVLRPPADFESWQDASGEGCSIAKLYGASGFLSEKFATKYGALWPSSQGL